MNKLERKFKRKRRVRKKIVGTAVKPRISIYRSNRYVFVQAVDDENQKVLVGSSDMKIKKKLNKSDKAKEVGKTVGEKLSALKIKSGVFDRNGNAYHGRVKAVADGLRESGLNI